MDNSPTNSVNPLLYYSRFSSNSQDKISYGTQNKWVKEELSKRKENFLKLENMRIFVGTWNVNGKSPPESLSDWICQYHNPDIFAIGFQEIDLTAEALLFGTPNSFKVFQWEQLIEKELRSSFDVEYYHLKSKQLVGMLLCIFVQKIHLPFIRSVKTSAAGVGLMRKMGNKGGVSIRFKFYENSFCFVNSHLSAHPENIQRRNQDYQDIIRRMTFYDEHEESLFSLFDHDNLFWFGDLNYRISLENEEVRNKLTTNLFLELLEHDQLTKQIRNGISFDKFNEGEITFPPTFKFDPWTTTYDSSAKNRTPSWCDRILWRGNSSHICYYKSQNTYQTASDHQAVSAFFRSEVNIIDPHLFSFVRKLVVNDLNYNQYFATPNCSISDSSLYFGDIRYLSPSFRKISLRNTGNSILSYKFKKKMGEGRYAKNWLIIKPPSGVLVPTEEVEIVFTIFVTNSSAPSLNLKTDSLSDIVILSIDSGSDLFITIEGNYMNSCFGNYLENLVRYPNSIRENPLPEKDDHLSCPKEISYLLSYLLFHFDKNDLFYHIGDNREVREIIELLDNGLNLLHYKGSVYSAAQTLILFLKSLCESVIPSYLYFNCINSSVSFSKSKKFLSYLSPVHYHTFWKIVLFLKEILSKNPNISPSKLAATFSNVMIRSPRENESFELKSRKAEFLFHFLSKIKINQLTTVYREKG